MRECQQYYDHKSHFFGFVNKFTVVSTQLSIFSTTVRMWFWVVLSWLDNDFGGKVGSLATWGQKISRSMLVKFEIRTCLLRIHQQKQIFFLLLLRTKWWYSLTAFNHPKLIHNNHIRDCHQAFWSIPFSNLDLCDE